MQVYGQTITDTQQAACIAAMRGEFQAKDIEAAAIAAGIPKFCNVGKITQEFLAYRVADRLIQKQRKAGAIERVGNYWVVN
jgi:hypothetical protein